MTKIHPKASQLFSAGSCPSSILEERSFTIWMKSLVLHGNGCTVYNSNGEVIFRVDNYQEKCRSKVFLMDSSGEVLCCIRRKKLRICGCWEGFKWIKSENEVTEKPWFQLGRNHKILSKEMSCNVSLKSERNKASTSLKIIGLEGKSTFKILDFSNQLLAEVKQKHSIAGVPFGKDVLTLMVKPQADQLLIISLVIGCGLINKKL